MGSFSNGSMGKEARDSLAALLRLSVEKSGSECCCAKPMAHGEVIGG